MRLQKKNHNVCKKKNQMVHMCSDVFFLKFNLKSFIPIYFHKTHLISVLKSIKNIFNRTRKH